MKQLNLIVFFTLLFFTSCEKEKAILDGAGNLYELKVSYESSMGNVTIEPLLDKYPSGTEVKVFAQAVEGKVFNGWLFNSDSISQEEISFTIETDIDLEAFFSDFEGPEEPEWPEGADSNEDPNNDTEVVFELDIKWVPGNTWEVKAILEDKNKFFDNEISNAVIKVDGLTLVEDDFYKGTYQGAIENLPYGQQFSITLQYSNDPELTYNVTLPGAFTEIPSLTGNKINDIINMEWESVECSGYYFYKKVENNYGSTATINVKNGSPMVETSYSISVSDIYNGNVFMSPAPCYFTLWVCPVNRYENLDGVASGSYIDVIGRKTNSLTNKS